jgi:hypothetical protein
MLSKRPIKKSFLIVEFKMNKNSFENLRFRSFIHSLGPFQLSDVATI